MLQTVTFLFQRFTCFDASRVVYSEAEHLLFTRNISGQTRCQFDRVGGVIPIENEAALWMTLDFVLYLLFRILRLPGSFTIWGGICIVLLCLHLKGFQQDSARLSLV